MTSRSAKRGRRRRDADAHAGSAAGETSPIDANRSLRRLLFLIFALAGLAGLVYEATWTRYLQLFLGHAAYAPILVLSLFMGGMAIGALAAPMVGRRAVAPLVAYAAIEAPLGVAAIVFHPLFDAATSFAYARLLPGSEGSGGVLVLQWAIASALILPTIDPPRNDVSDDERLGAAPWRRAWRAGVRNALLHQRRRSSDRRAARRFLADRVLWPAGDDDRRGGRLPIRRATASSPS